MTWIYSTCHNVIPQSFKKTQEIKAPNLCALIIQLGSKDTSSLELIILSHIQRYQLFEYLLSHR